MTSCLFLYVKQIQIKAIYKSAWTQLKVSVLTQPSCNSLVSKDWQHYLERPVWSEHSTEVVQSHGYEHDPGCPLRNEGEGVSCHHSCHHQVPLLHQNRSRAEEERNYPNHLLRSHTRLSLPPTRLCLALLCLHVWCETMLAVYFSKCTVMNLLREQCCIAKAWLHKPHLKLHAKVSACTCKCAIL